MTATSTAPVRGVVDSHIHLLPGRRAEKVGAFFHEHLAWVHQGQ